MKIHIEPGAIKHVANCIDAYKYSELGEVYYHSDTEMANRFKDGLKKGEIFVALDESKNCMGFIWIDLSGVFSGFPYCRVLAVKKEYRGIGVGSALMKHYENLGFSKAKKLFILVSDFNCRAKKLYEQLGFVQVGVIPDLFKNGVSEIIMVKAGPEDDVAQTG